MIAIYQIEYLNVDGVFFILHMRSVKRTLQHNCCAGFHNKLDGVNHFIENFFTMLNHFISIQYGCQ
jgi:hypothetical protein